MDPKSGREFDVLRRGGRELNAAGIDVPLQLRTGSLETRTKLLEIAIRWQTGNHVVGVKNLSRRLLHVRSKSFDRPFFESLIGSETCLLIRRLAPGAS